MASILKRLFGRPLRSDQRAIPPMRTEANTVKAGILTGEEILERNLIQDYRPERLEATSYDLSLGQDYRSNEGELLILQEDEQLIIPQYGVVLVCTQETIQTDNRTAGRFDLKIRHALRGLVLQVGTQVEPLYTGQLFGLIFNLSDREVRISEGDPIFTIEFHTLTSPISDDSGRKTVANLREFLRKKNILDQAVKSSLSYMKDEISNTLRDDLQRYVREQHAEWERQKTNRASIMLSVVLVMISLAFGAGLPVLINKITLDSDDTLIQQLRIQRAEEQFKNEQTFNDFIDYLRSHPGALERLLERVQTEQPSASPTPNVQTGTQNRPSESRSR